jgi:hypothetical protein
MTYNNNTIFLLFLLIILVAFYVIYFDKLNKTKEGWQPWVWNIPTRELYPPLYYSPRCSPPVNHYYLQTNCNQKKPLVINFTPNMIDRFSFDPDYHSISYMPYVYNDYPDMVVPYVCPIN